MTATTSKQRMRGTYSSPRQEERQRRILETARREITAVGYDALTMAQLAKASEVSTKTLYNLYGSKDELLLGAVAELMGNLEHRPEVEDAVPGVPTLLAFTKIIFRQIEETPAYAEVMARAMFKAESEHRLVDLLLGNSVRFAQAQLKLAVEAGQLSTGIDIDGMSRILTGHHWGVVLMWSKGMIATSEICERALQSTQMSLSSLAK